MKKCTKCKTEKELTEFFRNKNGKNGRDSRCKSCRSAYKKQYYSVNRVEILKQDLKRQKKRKEIIWAKIAEIHGTKCVNCGAKESKGKRKALELHHLNRNKKDFDVSRKFYLSWERVEAEVRKCVLLCKQCHLKEHKKLTNLKDQKIQQHEARVKELEKRLKKYE